MYSYLQVLPQYLNNTCDMRHHNRHRVIVTPHYFQDDTEHIQYPLQLLQFLQYLSIV